MLAQTEEQGSMARRVDVRMQGFQRRSEVAAVWEWIDRNAVRLPAEDVALEAATDRVLARNVVATLDVPAFDRAAMDGYALRGDETSGASDYNPLSFPLVGEVLPGRPFDGDIQAGTSIRIMTGAPVPQGVDAVVPAEYATESAGRIEIKIVTGDHQDFAGLKGEMRRRASIDLRQRLIHPQHLAGDHRVPGDAVAPGHVYDERQAEDRERDADKALTQAP